MSPPLVSVVIPAYNAERTIPSTLVSVLGQTVADIEVIVVDDGSIDSTSNIARSLRDSRLRVVRQANSGHAGARNTGIRHATGKYVAFVDADDLWLPRKLETQLCFLRRHPNVRALHSAAIHVDDGLRPLFIGQCPDGKNSLIDVSDLVFVDAVDTGYSRVVAGISNTQFHGVRGDLRAFGEFINNYLRTANRWPSPACYSTPWC